MARHMLIQDDDPLESSGPMTRFVTDAGSVTIAAAIVSVVLHVVGFWFIASRPIGEIDPSMIDNEPRMVRVKRAVEDVIVDATTGENLIREAERRVDLANLSSLLLEGKAAETRDPLTPLPARFRPIANDAPSRQTAPPDVLPASAMSDEVMDNLVGEHRLDVPYEPARGFGGSRTGSGPGGINASENATTGTDEAGRLLGEAGILAAANPEPPALDRPKRIETRAIDQRLIDAPVDTPAMDFSSFALQDTQRLNVPQHLDNDFDYEVTIYDAPRGEDYVRIDITGRRSLRKLQTMPKDVIFLIDTSSSIPQDWVDQVLAGVRQSLNSLNPGDRFNIVLFNEATAFFNPEGIVPFNGQTLADGQAFLQDAKATGYTDVNRALSRLLVRDLDQQRVYNLILISDGRPTRGVKDHKQLINMITRDNDLVASIYGIGVGRRQDRRLLDFLAYRNRGFCVYADEPKEAENLILNMVSQLRYPILKDLKLTAYGLDSVDLFPKNLPDIHQGETISVFGRFSRLGPFTMRVLGRNGPQTYDFTFTRNLRQAELGTSQIAQDWAFWKLHHLYSEIIRVGETPQLKDAIERLRDQYDLKTLY